jgi:hypothetical protein
MPFKTPPILYGSWRAMIARCENKNNPQYADYGGRGISICDRWSLRKGIGFRNFALDMGERPKGCTLDRIDNDKGYSPENCRWSTYSEQQLNQRKTRVVVIDGRKYKAAELAKQIGMKTDSVISRANSGLSFAEITDNKKRVFLRGLSLGGKANGERQKAKTHCPQGHEYTAENLQKNSKNHRSCKKCHAARTKAKRALTKG